MLNAYLARRRYRPSRLLARADPRLRMVIVIPAWRETGWQATLRSLRTCSPTYGCVEVIVVVNGRQDDPPETKAFHLRCYREILDWAARHSDARLRFLAEYQPELPPRDAGVGLARKLGMDTAVARFAQHDRRQGVIVNLDADCTVAPSYLTALETHFEENPSRGASIYFEHPYDTCPDAGMAGGIQQYELFLRYHIQALRWVGFPYAYHTVGSCMAVRADTYCQQGGMNKRQAGEDFYLLQKIIPLGGYADLTTTCVYPAARISDRVPFGTGRAMQSWSETRETELRVSALRSYEALIPLFQHVGELYDLPNEPALTSWLQARLTPPLIEYLSAVRFGEKWRELQQHTASREAFVKRFFGWFNAFRVMKYLHKLRDSIWPDRPVAGEARDLLTRLPGNPAPESLQHLLEAYRTHERTHPWPLVL